MAEIAGPATIAQKTRDARQHFVDLTSLMNKEHEDVGISASAVTDAFERFTLWAGNLGAMRAASAKMSLDSRLAEAEDIRYHICQQLDELVEATQELTDIVRGANPNCDMGVEQGMLDDEVTLDDEETTEYDSGDTAPLQDEPFSEAHMILQVIAECITSLFRLGILVRKSTRRDRFKRALQASDQAFSSMFDVDYVRHKHPKISEEWLLTRLGGGIAKRRQFIKYCRDHTTRLGVEDENQVVAPATATERLSSKATTFLAAQPVEAEVEDDVVSFVSATTMTESLTSLKLPRLADLSTDNQPFECPLCFTLQSFKSDKSWRIHAFRDLKAYVCTVGQGECDAEFFADRDSWFEHELREHRARYKCSLCQHGPLGSQDMRKHIQAAHGPFSDDQLKMLQDAGREAVTSFLAQDCPFCDDWSRNIGSKADPRSNPLVRAPDTLVSVSRFKRHVAAHQEQLAIFAVPRANDAEGTPGSGSVVALSNSNGFSLQGLDDLPDEEDPENSANLPVDASSDAAADPVDASPEPEYARSDADDINHRHKDEGYTINTDIIDEFERDFQTSNGSSSPTPNPSKHNAATSRHDNSRSQTHDHNEGSPGESPEILPDRQVEKVMQEEDAPIKFKDAVGRRFSFPFHLCKTWTGMEELIKQAFLHVNVIWPRVEDGYYHLLGPNGEIILPPVWDKVIKPGWSITMQMWPMDEPFGDPMHGIPAPQREGLQEQREEVDIYSAPPDRSLAERLQVFDGAATSDYKSPQDGNVIGGNLDTDEIDDEGVTNNGGQRGLPSIKARRQKSPGLLRYLAGGRPANTQEEPSEAGETRTTDDALVRKTSTGSSDGDSEHSRKGETRLSAEQVAEEPSVRLGYRFVQKDGEFVMEQAFGQRNIEGLINLSNNDNEAATPAPARDDVDESQLQSGRPAVSGRPPVFTNPWLCQVAACAEDRAPGSGFCNDHRCRASFCRGEAISPGHFCHAHACIRHGCPEQRLSEDDAHGYCPDHSLQAHEADELHSSELRENERRRRTEEDRIRGEMELRRLEEERRDEEEKDRREEERDRAIAAYNARDAERIAKEKEEKERREKEYGLRLRGDLRRAGLDDEDIEAIVEKDKGKRIADQKTIRPPTPTWTRMSLKHIDIETLDHFKLDWEYDRDPGYILIKRWVPEDEQDQLWAHTAELRRSKLQKQNLKPTMTAEPRAPRPKIPRERSRSPPLGKGRKPRRPNINVGDYEDSWLYPEKQN